MIELSRLRYRYDGAAVDALRDIDARIGAGTRTLLLGANGAGKSTLLRVLAGKHLVTPDSALIDGRSAFHDPSLARTVTWLGAEFPFDVDVQVGGMVERMRRRLPAPNDADLPRRLARLERLLEVDPGWHMHRVSDGQRRRVQLLLGLMSVPRVLLLDEVTKDLDVLARHRLLELLREDAERHGTTIIYATHVFDGLDRWATHLMLLRNGALTVHAPLGEIEQLRTGSTLLELVLAWLSEADDYGDGADTGLRSDVDR